VAFNTRWLLRPFEKFLRRSLDCINIVGGGAASDVWCQIFADILNRPVRQVADPIQANVRGAAFIAAVGLGVISYDDVPDHTEYQREYHPTAAHRDIYDTYFKEFVNIYRQNKGIYRRLNGRRVQLH
jgi:xylulokinase